jgi:hypothetical protein
VTLRLPLVDERPAVPVQSRRSADVVGAVR